MEQIKLFRSRTLKSGALKNYTLGGGRRGDWHVVHGMPNIVLK
jgi:hypothetical protein